MTGIPGLGLAPIVGAGDLRGIKDDEITTCLSMLSCVHGSWETVDLDIATILGEDKGCSVGLCD